MNMHRRRFLSVAALGAGAMWVSSHMALASVGTDRRFVFIIQRGAADGLDIVRPYGDPAYQVLRGAIAGEAAQSIKLDGMFALHPSLVELGKMYAGGEALFVHAVASPYRDRSHFDGQNVLETGGAQPYQVRDGWLNRLVSMMPHEKDEAIALAPTVPMALRGPTPVASYAPSSLPDATDDLMARVGMLYDKDPQLHPLWTEAIQAKGLAEGTNAKQDPTGLGRLAAKFLSRDNGPRIAMIETEGWDTHFAQAPRLTAQLKALDAMIAAMRDGMGPAWKKTTILVATEFDRTAAVNGTGGTDHGTASMAMLIGGAVRGGRVLTDWPGLASSKLYQDRDLRPTMALDALIAGAAAEALGLDSGRLAHGLFGTAINGKPVDGLIRA
ncbi:MAG: DUF1501 domain-containing protein [Rhizobiaceae bacterium]